MKKNLFFGLKTFVTLWAGQMISSFGTAMTNYALMIWAYQQQGTATSITLLAVCSYLPSILFCFAAGSLADRWDKKKIMLISDSVAAIGTVTVLLLYSTGALALWHLYMINFILSFMNAFQNPAAYVAVSLITPQEQYARVSGMQAFSSSLVGILTPALATAFLAFGGLKAVLLFDLISFAVAFLSLLLFVRIPHMPAQQKAGQSSPLHAMTQGFGFLRAHRPILKIILFFSLINLLASMGGNGIMPVMILSRTGGDQVALGSVSAAVGLGTLAGSLLVTAMKPQKRRTAVIFASCGISFILCDFLWGVGRSVPVWVFAAFAGNLPLPFLGANLTTIMRTKVPLQMQGRVFAARDTLQYITIPVGLYLGGILADHVFEPFMQAASPIQQLLGSVVGQGRGAGLAVLFLAIGFLGAAASFLSLGDADYRTLDE